MFLGTKKKVLRALRDLADHAEGQPPFVRGKVLRDAIDAGWPAFYVCMGTLMERSWTEGGSRPSSGHLALRVSQTFSTTESRTQAVSCSRR
jgi:hypothetical protein